MTRPGRQHVSRSALRTQVEAILSHDPANTPTLPTATVQILVHELQRHQAELEIQNEKLRRAQEEFTVVHDRREAQLRRSNRTLRAHSHSDQAMIHAVGEQEYLNAVCRIIIEDCGHAMVWIGYAEEDENKTVRPVAHAGFDAGYLETLKITWADTERGRGPTGIAIRTGKPSLCRNMLTDPNFEPWRAEAVKRGYASSLVLPLTEEGRVFGAMTLYSKEPDPFSEDEIALLTDLANDLAYGIKTIQLRLFQSRVEGELQRAAQELARSNLDLEQFAYVASHDLKEPLRMVTGFMSLLKDRYRGQLDAKAAEYIDFASEGAVRMQRTIDALLAYSRVGRDRGTTLTEMNVVLDGAVTNLQASVEECGAVVTRDPLPTLQANALEMTQVFQNLIGNAIKFRKPGVAPKIHVGIRKVTGQPSLERGHSGAADSLPMTHAAPQAPVTGHSFWLFAVRDNGIGLDPQFADRIFMIFQRLHTPEEYPGTGIGLAICKKIVEGHGGDIWVESEPGKGSTFYFTMPM